MKVISVEPLTRVEGRGRIELYLADGCLQRVQVSLLEVPRLFEGLVRGRSFREIPSLVCRICSICSAVHSIAAASAIEKALKVEIPPVARKVRELLLLGGHIESHALHLFCLIYPDLCGVDHLMNLLAQEDVCVKGGLELKRLGNRIQEVAGGRAIHPVNVEVGGIVVLPPASAMFELANEIGKMEEQLAELLLPFRAGGYPSGREAVGIRLSVAGSEEFSLQGEHLNLSDGRSLPADAYADLLKERSLHYSNARIPSGEIFLTGALARQEEFCRQQGRTFSAHAAGIHANNSAQADELVWALSRSRVLLNELLTLSGNEDVSTPVPVAAGSGTAIIEAPRGVLIHRYVLDDCGKIAAADIVTPTAINQRAISGQLLSDLAGLPEDALPGAAERIVRAFDPCISCAVHLLSV